MTKKQMITTMIRILKYIAEWNKISEYALIQYEFDKLRNTSCMEVVLLKKKLYQDRNIADLSIEEFEYLKTELRKLYKTIKERK